MSLKDPQIWHVMEDTGVLLLARVEDWDGNLLAQAGVTTITWSVFDTSDNNALVATNTIAAADVIFDTAESGGNWPYTDGYTFKWNMPATNLPNGGRVYVVEIMVDPVSGENFMIGPYYIHSHNRRGG